LNTFAAKSWMCIENLFNGFTSRQLIQDKFHRDASSYDYRLAHHDKRGGHCQFVYALHIAR